MEEEILYNNRIDLSELQNAANSIRREVGKIIVGQKNMIELLITALLADGHVLIEGVPGVAKTLTAKLLAKTIDANFSRIQFTPDLMPSDILGTSVFNFKTSEFNFNKGPIFANLVLIDEINRSPAKTQAALFEVMEERQISIDGNTFIMDYPFLVIATQNPIEHEGTYRLPEAQLDRFLYKIEVDYPTQNEEIEILNNYHSNENNLDINKVNKVLSIEKLKAIKSTIGKLHVEPNLIKYITEIVQNTRNNKSLYIGASPRASIAILTASKAYAAINGRDFVTPDDIKFVAMPVLKHRVILSAETEMEGTNEATVINKIIQSIEVPR